MSTATETAPQTEPERQEDLEAIVPSEIRVEIDGIPCRVERLRTKEFLALMRVLTTGLGPALSDVNLDFSSGDTVARDMSALMLLALPNAMPEFSVFLASTVKPVDPEKNAAISAYLRDNPELGVMIDVFEAIALQEKDDLAGLAGKAQAMWKRVAPLYTPKTKTGS